MPRWTIANAFCKLKELIANENTAIITMLVIIAFLLLFKDIFVNRYRLAWNIKNTLYSIGMY